MTATAITDVDLGHTVYALSILADVRGPDTKESPGVRLLMRVQDEANSFDADTLLESIREYVAAGNDLEDFGVNDLSDSIRDYLSEGADSCVQIYTYQCWQEFTDLCLWEEDLSDLGEISGTDLTRDIAMRAQYMVAERLLGILLAQRAIALAEANPEPEDDDEDEV